jgi:hypothetical protein
MDPSKVGVFSRIPHKWQSNCLMPAQWHRGEELAAGAGAGLFVCFRWVLARFTVVFR